MNINQRGKRVERELAQYLREQGFPTARRSEQYCGKAGDSDILVDDLPTWHIECKATKSPVLTRSQIEKWCKQVAMDSKDGQTSVIFNKADKHGWIAIMPIEDYAKAFGKTLPIDPYIVYGESANLREALDVIANEFAIHCQLAAMEMDTHAFGIKDAVYCYDNLAQKLVIAVDASDWCATVRELVISKSQPTA